MKNGEEEIYIYKKKKRKKDMMEESERRSMRNIYQARHFAPTHSFILVLSRDPTSFVFCLFFFFYERSTFIGFCRSRRPDFWRLTLKEINTLFYNLLAVCYTHMM